MTAIVILAGGAGRRMGGNKPFHPYGRSTLIGTVIDSLRPAFDTVAVNAGAHDHPLRESFQTLGVPLLFDERLHGMGPLSGVLTALRYAADRGEEQVVTVPCDMPDIPADMVKRLLAATKTDLVFYADERDHPLLARWDVRILPRLSEALTRAAPVGGLAVAAFVETLDPLRLSVGDDPFPGNVNLPSGPKLV